MISLLSVCLPFVFSVLIQQLSHPNDQTHFVFVLLLLYGVLWTVTQLISQLRSLFLAYVVEDSMSKLSLLVFDHLHQLSLRFHLDRRTGAVLSAIERAQSGFETVMWGIILFLLPVVLELLCVFLVLAYYYGVLAGVFLLIVVCCFVAINVRAMEKISCAQKEYNDKRSSASSALFDSLLNVELVRYFTNQRFDHERCRSLLHQQKKAGIARHYTDFYLNLVQHLLVGAGFTVVTWFTGNAVVAGSISLAEFVLINGYFLQFIMPLQHIAYAMQQMRKGLQDMDQVYDLLALQPEIKDHSNAVAISSERFEVVFDNVSFGYDPLRPILKNISFSIEQGKTVAVVGPSGSGKSTLVRLLFRFFDTTSGSICVNGHNIQMITQESLHTKIGVVPQNVVLFNNTVRFNIAYGNPSANQEEIERVVKQAQLYQLIQSLPQGYDTEVGERGLKLSGGESQRVAIARVLLKKPALYIFDEATSALDSGTEREIQQTIREISFGVPSLIIAHRLSTISHADEILVLDKGCIVEQGSHNHLLAADSFYATLWQKQMQSVSS